VLSDWKEAGEHLVRSWKEPNLQEGQDDLLGSIVLNGWKEVDGHLGVRWKERNLSAGLEDLLQWIGKSGLREAGERLVSRWKEPNQQEDRLRLSGRNGQTGQGDSELNARLPRPCNLANSPLNAVVDLKWNQGLPGRAER
jgi:hypothetical protein